MRSILPILLATAATGLAQSNPEPVAVLELGAATDWNTKGGAASFGPDLAVEITPIENWLELEAGVTPVFKRHSAEWDTDLLFKKPWTISKKMELMFGAGPEWVHSRGSGLTANSVAGEAVLDFMFWPGATHRFGWFLEPAFDYNFAQPHERSLGISAGLLIGIFRGARR